MNLAEVKGRYAVVQLPPDAALPTWLDGPGLCGTVRSSDELTIVCAEDRVPKDAVAQRGWACLRSIGPFGFDEAGVVAVLVSPIATAGVGVFVLCTFDGEHILCPAKDFDTAKAALVAEGHSFASEH